MQPSDGYIQQLHDKATEDLRAIREWVLDTYAQCLGVSGDSETAVRLTALIIGAADPEPDPASGTRSGPFTRRFFVQG